MWKKAIYHLVALAIWLTLIFAKVINQVRDRYPQTWQGFICGDPSLSRNFKPNTYPSSTLNNIIYVTPFCVVAIELVIHGRKTRKNFIITAVRCLLWVQQYFFVFILNFITVQYIKSISGFLRPYFLSECMPDLAVNCTRGEFIDSTYVCTNTKMTAFVRRDLARSFPSLNTAIATYPMVFILWYLQRRVSKIPLLIPILVVIALAWTLFASITRITDHTHHSVDVIGAVILMIPFALYLNYVGCKNFNVSSKLERKGSFKCIGIMECSLCKQKTN